MLPVSARVEDFVTESTPRLMKNVLASWNVERCREWLEDDLGLELGIEHVSNKYFPLSNSSKEVRDKLLRACEDTGVRVRYGASVEALRRVGGDGGDKSGWALRLADAPEERAPVVVLAMGGLSFPAVGTDGTGYAIARRDLGHTLKEPYPALVPLTGDHPGGEALVIAIRQHLRDGDAAEDRRSGGRGARDRGEARLRHHGRDRQPAGNPANPLARGVEELRRHPGMEGQEAD